MRIDSKPLAAWGSQDAAPARSRKRTFALSCQFADDIEEYRRQEDAEQGNPQHAEKDRRPERSTHLGAGPLRDHEWQHAEDEREGGHDDRSQPYLGGFDRGVK